MLLPGCALCGAAMTEPAEGICAGCAATAETARLVRLAENLPEEGPGGVRFRVLEIGGRLEAVMSAQPGTTELDLRRALPDLLRWRDRVAAAQPTGLAFGRGVLSRLHQAGEASYADIVAQLNEQIARALTQWMSYLLEKGLLARIAEGGAVSDAETRDENSSLQAAMYFLALGGLSEAAAFEALQDGMLEIIAGRPPFAAPAFPSEYPISRDTLIARLRQYRQRRGRRRFRWEQGSL